MGCFLKLSSTSCLDAYMDEESAALRKPDETLQCQAQNDWTVPVYTYVLHLLIAERHDTMFFPFGVV